MQTPAPQGSSSDRQVAASPNGVPPPSGPIVDRGTPDNTEPPNDLPVETPARTSTIEPDVMADEVSATPVPARSYGPWILAGLLLAALAAALSFAKKRAASRREEQAPGRLHTSPVDPIDAEPAPIREHGIDDMIGLADLVATPDMTSTSDLLGTTDPMAMPALVAASVVDESTAVSRPRLRIAFKPSAARATDASASVEFTLSVSNAGDAPARRVQMEARMFAMGADHDAALARFFEAPLARPTAIASNIAPGMSADLRAQVTLPREAMNPIRHGDRVLFVPLVAFNLMYEWGDGEQDQLTMSYVIGRENRPPAAKMAPFRLDLGPRVYREVGQRAHQPKQLA